MFLVFQVLFQSLLSPSPVIIIVSIIILDVLIWHRREAICQLDNNFQLPPSYSGCDNSIIEQTNAILISSVSSSLHFFPPFGPSTISALTNPISCTSSSPSNCSILPVREFTSGQSLSICFLYAS